MTTLMGANPLVTHTAPQFALGATHTDHLGREFVYVQATEVVTAGMMCIIHGGWTCEGVTATLAAHDAGAGKLCGLALVAFADNAYGWLARRGTGADFLVNLVGACDDFQPLAPTSTAGSLDNFDAGSATAPFITGCVITTAAGGAEQEICILEFPQLQTDYPA
ncbi:MAG: hypothetical protein AB7O44_27370 [Hyphomicrobiaceae bacterium]